MKSKNPVSSSEASFTKSFLMSAQILPSLTPKDQKNKLNFGNSILQSTEDFFDRDTPARNIFFKSPKNQSTVVISQQLKNLPKLQFGVDAGGLKIRNVAAKKLEVDRQTDTNPVISSVQKITANTPKGQEHQPTRGNYVSKSLASIRRVPDHHLLSPPMKQIFKVPASKFNKTNKQSKKSHQSSSQNYLESVTKIIKALKLPPNA